MKRGQVCRRWRRAGCTIRLGTGLIVLGLLSAQCTDSAWAAIQTEPDSVVLTGREVDGQTAEEENEKAAVPYLGGQGSPQNTSSKPQVQTQQRVTDTADGSIQAAGSAGSSGQKSETADSNGQKSETAGESDKDLTDTGNASNSVSGNQFFSQIDQTDHTKSNTQIGNSNQSNQANFNKQSKETILSEQAKRNPSAVQRKTENSAKTGQYAEVKPQTKEAQQTNADLQTAADLQTNTALQTATDQQTNTDLQTVADPPTTTDQQTNADPPTTADLQIKTNQQTEESRQKEACLQTIQPSQGEFRLWITGLVIIYVMACLLWFLIFQSKGGKEKMRKLWKKAAGCILLLLFTSVWMPMHSHAAQGADTQAEEELLLFAMDPLTAGEEELNKALGNAQWEDIGVWLLSMDEQTRAGLLRRHTLLTQKTTIMKYRVSESGDMLPVQPLKEPKELLFYEYAMETAAVNRNAKATFAHKSGYYQYQFVKQGQICTFTVKLSGIDTTLATTVQQEVTISVSRDGTNFVNFSQNAGNYNSTSGGYTTCKLRRAFGDTQGGFYNLYVGFTFKKPKGYTGSVKYLNNAPSARGDLYFYDNGNYQTSKKTYSDTNTAADVTESVIACTNIIANTTVASSNTTGTAMIYQIVLTPVTFTTTFHGNGATGGSVASQSNVYDNTYLLPANGFSRQYTVDFNGNGGTPAQANAVAAYQFAGWGFGQGQTVTHLPGQTYSNYTTQNAATGTFHAIWNPASVKLPVAERTGYSFKGWASSSNATAGQAANEWYTPASNTTLYAIWEPVNYVVRYYDGITNAVRGTQNMVYGTNASLSSLSSLGIGRAGYTFKGWAGSTGIYQDGQGVLNLTSEKDGIVNLTAVWEANTNTPYQVEHYKEQNAGEGDYVLAETQKLQGTTDSSVTPAVKLYDNYKSPEMTTTTIAGDGSTVVVYRYERIAPQYAEYKVEHYFQNTGDMSRYDLNEEYSEEGKAIVGSSVTPNVLTQYTDYEVPAPQTVTVSEDGSTVIKYYYHLKQNIKEQLASKVKEEVEVQVREQVSGQVREQTTTTNITNQYTTETFIEKEDSAKGDINHFKPGDTKYFQDAAGNKYEIYVNQDGTLTIRAMNPASSAGENLRLANTLTINNTKYKVTQIAPYAFKNNKKIKTLTIGNGITTLGKGAFEGCTNLKSVKFGTGLSVIGARAFYGCTNLQTVKTTKTITTIGSKAFYNCRKLKSYTIGKYVKSIGTAAFRGCARLGRMVISESVETIGRQAFYQCRSLKQVTFKTDRLLKIGGAAFKKCHKSLKFVVPAKKKKAYAKLLKGKI